LWLKVTDVLINCNTSHGYVKFWVRNTDHNWESKATPTNLASQAKEGHSKESAVTTQVLEHVSFKSYEMVVK
jgi:hypothetical protein